MTTPFDIWGDTPIEATPYEILLEQNYPLVNENYRQVWDRSDKFLPQNDDWLLQLQTTATALDRAAKTCREMIQPTERTTPSELRVAKNVLLHAVHETEALIMELSLNYPIHSENYYTYLVADPELSKYAPKLLLRNNAEFVLWMPMLPSRQRAVTSVLFHATDDFIRNANLPRIQNWHADFIHCYHPDHIVGVRDVDNYDYKPIVDALARAMYAKDSYEHYSCSMYNFATIELRPGCYIYVSERSKKVRFFQEFLSLVKAV